MATRLTLGAACLLAGLGCGSAIGLDAGSSADAGTSQDAGSRSDAEPSDAGLGPDAGGSGDASGLRDAGRPRPDSGTQVGLDFRVRVVAANLTSGNLQSYDPGHGLRILEALRPDVVLIQEINYRDDTPADFRRLVDQVCGPECALARAQTGSLPNGVISRWPILESGTWPDDEVGNRGFTWARIDLPGATDLWAVSVHLLTRNASVRTSEANQLTDYIRTQVPDEAYLVIGGDLNTNTRTEGALQTLAAVVRIEGEPADGRGNSDTNASRSKPYDWVLPDPDLNPYEIPVELAGRSFPGGLVFDTRIFEGLDELPAVQPDDSDAPQMQHMAVVRDFLVRR